MRNDYLAHHGVLGQKWGVRRYQGYDGRRLDKRPKLAKKINEFRENRKRNAIRSSERRQHMKAYSFNDIKRIEGIHTSDEDMAAVNPDFGKRPGTTMNCVLCSVAYEMRKRGYDVEANESTVGITPFEITEMFPHRDRTPEQESAQFAIERSKAALEKSISNDMPDGARGVLLADYNWYGDEERTRHCVVWEKENGRTILRDCQSNMKTTLAEAPIHENAPDKSSYIALRLDNFDFDNKLIMDAVRPRRKT